MKMVKKLGIITLLSVAFLLSIFSIKTEAASLYVQSTEIPEEATENAIQHWEDYLTNMIYSENKQVSDYYLGQPFTISYPKNTKYNYPIISSKDKHIEYMLQINQSDYQNPETFILSKALAKKLEDLSEKLSTDENQAILLEGANQNLFYNYQGERMPLFIVDGRDPIEKKINTSRMIIRDVAEKIATPNLKKSRASVEFDNNVLPWTVYETQGENPWCQYYAYAAVINNQAGKEITSAKKIIDGEYPDATDEQKADIDWITSGSLYDSIAYVNKTFKKDIKFENNILSFERVKNEIDNKRPVVANLKSYDDDDSVAGHAIVLMGYTAAKGNTSYKPFYHYWNPWWEDTFVVSSSSPYMSLGPYNYTWNRTVFNFKGYIAEKPMEITEVSKTIMVNSQPKTIDTLPWGRNGFEMRSTSSRYTGMVLSITQDSGNYVYSPGLRGWIDKKGVTEVIATNITAKIEKSGFSIDIVPWHSGIALHEGYTKDHIGQQVTIRARSGLYYYVPDMGWIDKKAFNTATQKAVDATPNQNKTTNTKWKIIEIERTAEVLGNGKSVDSLPWGKSGYAKVDNLNSHTGKNIRLTQEQGPYVYSPDVRGWIDVKGLGVQF